MLPLSLFPRCAAHTSISKHLFAISQRNHRTQRSNLDVLQSTIFAACAEIMIRQKVMDALGVCLCMYVCGSRGGTWRACCWLCSSVHLPTNTWLMKRNLLMCLRFDISQDLSCSCEKKEKPLTSFRHSPELLCLSALILRKSQHQQHNYISFTLSFAPCQTWTQLRFFALKKSPAVSVWCNLDVKWSRSSRGCDVWYSDRLPPVIL